MTFAEKLKNLDSKTFPVEEIPLIVELYDSLCLTHCTEKELLESILNDYKHDYLTKNKGRDGRYYWWYLDETKNAAIRVPDGELISDEKELEKLFY